MSEFLSGVKKVYLVGIGGIGMSGLALLLKDMGLEVWGSDSSYSQSIDVLEKEGINVFIGHKRERVSSDIQLLSYSSAVKEDNPEIIEAKKRGIIVLKRGALLAELCNDKKTIAVSGSHGKTTTTSLVSHLLTSLGYQPTVFLGGQPLNYSRGAWWGGEHFAVETDESDGSFLYYTPWVSIITNIDSEHLDYYHSMDNLKKSFLNFACQTKEKVFGWGDQPYIKEILSEVGGISFGWQEHNLVRGKNFCFDGEFSCFDVYVKQKFITRAKSPLLGKHNCFNALSAFAFFSYIGEDLNTVNQALKDFKGTKRRFQIRESVAGVTFVDDYAHHPTEIRAVLSAARLLNPKRIFMILQPHRFSRIKRLKEDFSKCFSEADEAVITDVYGANEDEIEGVGGEQIFEEANKSFSGNIQYIPKNRLLEEIPSYLEEGDLVLALGAGDINILMEKVRSEFKKNRVKL